MIYFYSVWKFMCIQKDYMRVLVLTSLAVILFLVKSSLGEPVK